jgi:hypothetical protein
MTEKQKVFRLKKEVREALEKDAALRGVPETLIIEMLLAEYYGIKNLIIDADAVKRAIAVLQGSGYRVTRDDFEEAKPSGKEKK